ncbi:MAG: trypsin-like peptidase domain-containing protein [Okeania sp. SIO3C4]|nr:trypsin-like peptidase domain-containing protein [Okeania sp. SIO3C4]
MSNLEESIVLITSASDDSRKANVIGTGFAFDRGDSYTYLLTCAHVVEDVGGEENVLVNKIRAKVLAIGDVQGFDLAVLRVENLNVPLFQLISLSEAKNRKFRTAGHHLYGEEKKILLETVNGTLGKKRFVRQNNERVAVWNLLVDEGDRLPRGYSGAPVVDWETGHVLGIATNMEKDGAEGLAISVEALKKIWPQMPPAVSYFYLEKKDLFLEEFRFIDQEDALPGAFLPPGTKLTFQGQSITPLIPLNPILLDYFTPEELIAKVKLVQINSSDGPQVRVTLDLPLSGMKDDPQQPQNYQIYKDYPIKEENALPEVPVLEVWPW